MNLLSKVTDSSNQLRKRRPILECPQLRQLWSDFWKIKNHMLPTTSSIQPRPDVGIVMSTLREFGPSKVRAAKNVKISEFRNRENKMADTQNFAPKFCHRGFCRLHLLGLWKGASESMKTEWITSRRVRQYQIHGDLSMDFSNARPLKTTWRKSHFFDHFFAASTASREHLLIKNFGLQRNGIRRWKADESRHNTLSRCRHCFKLVSQKRLVEKKVSFYNNFRIFPCSLTLCMRSLHRAGAGR